MRFEVTDLAGRPLKKALVVGMFKVFLFAVCIAVGIDGASVFTGMSVGPDLEGILFFVFVILIPLLTFTGIEMFRDLHGVVVEVQERKVVFCKGESEKIYSQSDFSHLILLRSSKFIRFEDQYGHEFSHLVIFRSGWVKYFFSRPILLKVADAKICESLGLELSLKLNIKIYEPLWWGGKREVHFE